jgi:glycosyltransferase involved in cell wall biosynthesis
MNLHVSFAPAPRVSVVIPTYNRHATLAELFESLASQTFKDFEVLAVNDAGQPIDAVVALFPELNVTVIDQPFNQRQAVAINAGLERARGELVMLCDDDDLLAPCHLARLVARLDQADAPDLAFADAEVFGFVTDAGTRRPTTRRLWAHDFVAEVQERYLTVIPSGTVYRRAVHDTVGKLDVTLPCYWDWDFMLRLLQANHTVARVPVASVAYAFGSHNCTSDPAVNEPMLARLAVKHGLTGLYASNFLRLLDEPELQALRRPSQRVWDGKIAPSRWAARYQPA